MKRKKKEASDFLAPPSASLLEARPVSSAARPFGDHRKNNEPTMSSNVKAKAHNNLHNRGVIDINEDEGGKKNICSLYIKKHHTTMAGTDLFGMFTSACQWWTLLPAPLQL
jgi:hypothetical protein